MTTWTPDLTFYPSPRMAMKAPPEKHAYVAAFDPARRKPDTIAGGRRRGPRFFDLLAGRRLGRDVERRR